jgi:hypothetical protein
MSDYQVYDKLQQERPEMIISERLRNSGTVQKLIDLAKERDYRISFERGRFRHDLMMINGGQEVSCTVMQALRMLQ